MRRPIYPLILVSILIAGFVNSAAAQTGVSRSSPACIGRDFAEREDPAAREALCLRELANTASGEGNVLTLKLGNGSVKTYRSEPEACTNDNAEACVRYRLIGYHASAGLFLVHAQGYEGHDSQFVNAQDGDADRVFGIPHFAPDGSTFVVINNDITGVRQYDLAIGTVATKPPALTWGRAPNDNESWEFQRWLDGNRVALRNTMKTEACPGGNCEVVLTRVGSGWRLDRARGM
jgi:hypothetical protein